MTDLETSGAALQPDLQEGEVDQGTGTTAAIEEAEEKKKGERAQKSNSTVKEQTPEEFQQIQDEIMAQLDAEAKGVPIEDSDSSEQTEADQKKAVKVNQKIEDTLKMNFANDVRKRVHAAFENQANATTCANLSGEDQTRCVINYLIDHKTQIEDSIEKVMTEQLPKKVEAIKEKKPDAAFAEIIGEEEGTPEFEEKKKAFLESLVQDGYAFLVTGLEKAGSMGFASSSWDELMAFLLNPGQSRAFGISAALESGEGNDKHKKTWESHFKYKLKNPAEFLKVLNQAYDKPNGLKTLGFHKNDLEWSQAISESSPSSESMNKVMKSFLKDLLDGTTATVNERWHKVNPVLAKYFYPSEDVLLGEDVLRKFYAMSRSDVEFRNNFPTQSKDTTKSQQSSPSASPTAA